MSEEKPLYQSGKLVRTDATEARRLRVREMLAKQMGWLYVPTTPQDTCYAWVDFDDLAYTPHDAPPDPYTSAEDCMALMEWWLNPSRDVGATLHLWAHAACAESAVRTIAFEKAMVKNPDTKTRITETIYAALGGVE